MNRLNCWKITQSEMDDYLAAWHAGNDAGHGYPIGLEEHTPAEAVAWEAKERHYDSGRPSADTSVLLCATMEGGAVLASIDGRLVVVADANGPWAVAV
tara:strand:+ start:635 stop:928 length:294 start_codon:yes stop_codon:yes gene_type:complete